MKKKQVTSLPAPAHFEALGLLFDKRARIPIARANPVEPCGT